MLRYTYIAYLLNFLCSVYCTFSTYSLCFKPVCFTPLSLTHLANVQSFLVCAVFMFGLTLIACLPSRQPACQPACLPSCQPASPSAAGLPAYTAGCCRESKLQNSRRRTNLAGCMLTAKYVNLQLSCARHLMQNTWFTDIYVYFILFCVQTQRSNSQSRKK